MNSILKRKIFFTILPFVECDEIVVITGMRRVGKSSVLKNLYNYIDSSNKIMFDIENPIERAVFEEKDFNNIVKNLTDKGIKKDERIYVFLDEIQSYPAIVTALKYLYDHYKIKFFVTGSSSFYLKNLFPESLSGRKIEFEMYPLDFEEFLYFKGVDKELVTDIASFIDNRNSKILYEKRIKWYDEYLQFGGFPQVVLSKSNELKKKYLTDIYKSYYQTDLLQLTNMRNINQLQNLVKLLAVRVGNKVDINRLALELGMNRETIYNYLSFLSGSYMFHFVTRFGKSIDKEISSLQKVFICDLGLAKLITNISEGALLENAVYLNLRKYGKVNYYHDKAQNEIDFILPANKLALEVKRTVIINDVKKLQSFASKSGFDIAKVCSYTYSDLDNTISACLI